MISERSHSISEILFLRGICDLECNRVTSGVIDYNFSLRPNEDSPSLSIHVISGPVSKLKKLSIPVPSSYRKGIVRAIYPPSMFVNTSAFIDAGKLSIGEISDDPAAKVTEEYLPPYPDQTFRVMSGSGRTTDRLITELFKESSVSTVYVTAMKDPTTVQGWSVGYNIILNLVSEEFSPWIRIEHRFIDRIGLPIFKVYGPYLKPADTVTTEIVKGISGAMMRVNDIIEQLEKINVIERAAKGCATDTGDTQCDQLR